MWTRFVCSLTFIYAAIFRNERSNAWEKFKLTSCRFCILDIYCLFFRDFWWNRSFDTLEHLEILKHEIFKLMVSTNELMCDFYCEWCRNHLTLNTWSTRVQLVFCTRLYISDVFYCHVKQTKQVLILQFVASNI